MADSMRIRPPDPSDRVAGLASSIIHAYHGEHDADAALALLADPFSWIGADEGDGGIASKVFERVAQRRPSPRRATISSTSATMPSSLRPAHISSPEATGFASLPQQTRPCAPIDAYPWCSSAQAKASDATRSISPALRRRRSRMPAIQSRDQISPRSICPPRDVESFRARRNSSGASTKLVLDITEHVEIERALVKISYEDALTHLFNRSRFRRGLENERFAGAQHLGIAYSR